MYKLILSRALKNWKAGFTVALVSIPLSVSLALAGGATPQMGIITAIWAGLVAAILGGSTFNVVGPTGALSGILASYSLLNGVGTLPLLAILSGVLILIVFALRLERFIVLIPASVLHGFTLGVALTIGLGQVNSALGLHPLEVHETFLANQLESFRFLSQTSLPAAALFLAGLVFLLALSSYRPKFPWVVVLSLVGIGIGLMSSKHLILFDVPTILSRYGSIPSSIVNLHPINLGLLTNSTLLTTAGAVAVVAILETLISGKIADTMTHTRFNQRREIMGLGAANVLSGLLGGIPATAALARTSLNIASGSTSKISAAISSVTVAIISLVFLSYFQYLPLALVASILVYVAVRMVKGEHFKNLYDVDKGSFWLAIGVAILTVAWEPLYAIAVGTGLALLFFVDKLAQAHLEVNVNDEKARLVARISASEVADIKTEHNVLVYRFSGELVYINAQAHLFAIEQIKDGTKAVILSLRNLYYIDIDGMDTLAEIRDILKRRQKVIFMTGVNEHIRPLIEKTAWYREMLEEDHVFPSTQDALRHISSDQVK